MLTVRSTAICYVASAGACVPSWSGPECRVAGGDADAGTPTVAQRAAFAGPGLDLHRIAVRYRVPDYGCAFQPESEAA